MQASRVPSIGGAVLAKNNNSQSISAYSFSSSNPIARHWRGSYHLLPTLVITLIGLRVLLGMLQTGIPAKLIDMWVVISVALFFWQAVGTSRSADRFVKYTGNIIGVLCAYFLMLVAAVLTFTQVADALASKHKPEPYQILSRQMMNRTLPVISKEGVMRVDGNLDWELFGAFEQTLENNPSVKSVRLGSAGGYVFVARAMALKILERSLDTHIATHCYSACTVAFLAGEKRTMAESAKLGFHQYKLEAGNQPELINVADELERDRQFFVERGLSDEFVKQVFTAGHSELWIPDSALLSPLTKSTSINMESVACVQAKPKVVVVSKAMPAVLQNTVQLRSVYLCNWPKIEC